MKIQIGDMQYAPYGAGYVRRASAEDEWEVATDLPRDIVVAIAVAHAGRDERARIGPVARAPKIVRAGRNREIAEALGFTGEEADVAGLLVGQRSERPDPADTLALRLLDGSALGTEARVEEDVLDGFAADLGLSPEEMRDRFAGRHAS